MAQDHHHRAVRVHSLRRAEVVDAFICDDVCKVVLWRQKVSQQIEQSDSETAGLTQILSRSDSDLLFAWLEFRFPCLF